jgi:hypothetical protein
VYRARGRFTGVNSTRSVEPELLDGLPEDSPAACASRRDLRHINRLLGSRSWFGEAVQLRRQPGERILEIGAGTGELGRSLDAAGAELAGLDRCRRPASWLASAFWFRTDVLDFSGWSGFPVVIGNLFFHHFDTEQLGALGAQLNRHARVIVASEPLRSNHALRLLALASLLIRAHPVTRHDGRVSIVAGFRRDELPRLLRLDPAVWSWQTHDTWRGASRMVAERRI